MKLWVKAKVRPIRFHELRHTTGSLLFQTGANPAAVQRILRHSDPRITTETYGHLAPGYLRDEVDRMRFGMPSSKQSEAALQSSTDAPESEPATAVAASFGTAVIATNAEPFAAYLLQAPSTTIRHPPTRRRKLHSSLHLQRRARQDSNLRPAA